MLSFSPEPGRAAWVRLGHQVLAIEPHFQAWLQRWSPVTRVWARENDVGSINHTLIKNLFFYW